MTKERKSYPGDVSDEEWGFCAPYLTLMKGDAPQREHPLRELYNGLRWFVRAGCPWRMMPNDLPPWQVVQQQTQRWLRARIVSSTWRMTGAWCLRRTAGGNVELAYVVQGYTGEKPAAAGGGQTPRGQALALSCCPDAGWWNARSRGRRASGGWPAITNGSPPPSQAATGWSSPPSCSVLLFPKVHDGI